MPTYRILAKALDSSTRSTIGEAIERIDRKDLFEVVNNVFHPIFDMAGATLGLLEPNPELDD